MADSGDPAPCAASDPPAQLRLVAGVMFASREECKRYIHDVALAQGRRALLTKSLSGGNYFVFRCSSKTACPFEIRVTKCMGQAVRGFVVSSIALAHRGYTGIEQPTAHQIRQLGVTRAAVKVNPEVPAKTLQKQVKDLAKVRVGKRMAHRVQEALNEEFLGDYDNDFARVDSLLKRFCDANPTSHCDFQCDDQGRYRRAFLSNPIVPRHVLHGQKILGIDGTFMKHGKYREVLLILVGRNGNNKNVVLALGLCKSEDEDNCAWFLRNASKAGVSFQGCPVFSDRERGLCAALEKQNLGLLLRFCTRHIVGNIKSHFKGNVPHDLSEVVYRIQAAETEEEYKSHLFSLSLTHPHIAEYVANIAPEKWVMHPASVREIKMYGWRTTNFVESANNEAIKPRLMFPLQLFQHYMDDFLKDAVANEKQGQQWKLDGSVLTPYAEALVEEQRELSREYTVLWKNSSIAFVCSTKGIPVQRRVDLDKQTCTCPYMRQLGLPCRHFIAALVDILQPGKMHEVCDPCYLVANFLDGYGCGRTGGVELVQPEDIKSDQTLPRRKIFQL